MLAYDKLRITTSEKSRKDGVSRPKNTLYLYALVPVYTCNGTAHILHTLTVLMPVMQTNHC